MMRRVFLVLGLSVVAGAVTAPLNCKRAMEFKLEGRKVHIQKQEIAGATILRFRVAADHPTVIASASRYADGVVALNYFLSSGLFSNEKPRRGILDRLLAETSPEAIQVEFSAYDPVLWEEFRLAYNQVGNFRSLTPEVASRLWIGRALVEAGFDQITWLAEGNFPGPFKGQKLERLSSDHMLMAIVSFRRRAGR